MGRNRNQTPDRVERTEEPEKTRGTAWVCGLPPALLEPHPLVKALREAIAARDELLALKEREISRLQVALTFGLKDLPAAANPIRSPQSGTVVDGPRVEPARLRSVVT